MRQTPTAAWLIKVTFPTITEPEQKAWNYLWEDDTIAPFSCVEHEVYTVEEGTRLMLHSALCSATSNTTGIASSKIMKVNFAIGYPGFLGDWYFRRTDSLTFTPSLEIKPENTLYIYFHNLSSDSVKITVNIIGLLVAV